MAFMIFDRRQVGGKPILCPTQEPFKLAGYNLLHAAWTKRGSPIETGWHVAANELIQLHYNGTHDLNTKRFVIDFDPNTTRRIGLIELLDVYAFTWGDGSQGPRWTPLMLRFRNLFYEEYDPHINPTRKAEIIACLKEPADNTPDFVEFLYLNGPQFGWNWGMNGSAREYFRQFF